VVAFETRSGQRARLWLAAAGAAAGLVALTKPEFEAALLIALVAYLVLRAPRERGWRRTLADAGLVALPAVAIPAIAYGAVLTSIPLSQLLTDNLFPVGALRDAGAHVLNLSAPLTAESFLTLAARLAAYAAGAAAIVALGHAIDRGGRRGRIAGTAAIAAGSAFLVLLAAHPEAIRYALQSVYGWLPAGAAIAAVALAWRARRSGSRPSARLCGALVLAVFLAVLGAKTYAAFYPHPNAAHPQTAEYALPFAALFLAWLHLDVLPGRSAAVRLVGAGWLGLLACAGVVLTVRDARTETVTVSGPHGTLAAPPADGRAFEDALREIADRTSPGDPILLAPQLTTLYVMSGREEPLPQVSLLPGALAGRGAERQAIARMQRVKLAITSRRAYSSYGYGSFGRSFDRELGAWLRRDFRQVATLRGSVSTGTAPAALDVWQRRQG
jgi:hypothetical protein